MAIAPHKKIREEMISKITDERVRLIVGSQFSAIPVLEAEYYDYISQNPFYAGVFTRWVLSQSPLPPTPTEEEFYRMREDILGISGIAEPKTIQLDESLLLFFLDICSPFIEPLVAKGVEYYALSKSDKELVTAAKEGAFSALLLCDFEHVQKENYPLFLTAFLDAFRIYFYSQIGAPAIGIPADDAKLVEITEKEWTRLHAYSDSLYGFEVMPVIPIEMMLKYLRLPFSNQEHRKLSATQAYRQVLNYVVALATFKPVPDTRVKAYFRQELCSLYVPLAEKIIKREAKKGALSKENLRTIVLDEIVKVASEFDYFYATKKNLTNKKISPFDVMVFPLTDRYTAKLGHISDSDEFPFTSYLEQKLEARMKFYFAEDARFPDISLDEEFVGEDGEKWTRLDTLSADSPELTDYAQHIPDYDAKSKNGELIGWKMNTFASITGKSKDTLKRWNKEGLLVPKRYPIYSPTYKKQIEYRAYVQEDIPKAKEVDSLKAKKMRHRE
jgi:hypothetical protein